MIETSAIIMHVVPNDGDEDFDMGSVYTED